MIEFSKKNKVTAINVSIWKIVKEYVWWTLGGKPDKHWVGVSNGDKNETR